MSFIRKVKRSMAKMARDADASWLDNESLREHIAGELAILRFDQVAHGLAVGAMVDGIHRQHPVSLDDAKEQATMMCRAWLKAFGPRVVAMCSTTFEMPGRRVSVKIGKEDFALAKQMMQDDLSHLPDGQDDMDA